VYVLLREGKFNRNFKSSFCRTVGEIILVFSPPCVLIADGQFGRGIDPIDSVFWST
jgi:hypothetical protein